jgi:DNA polymerase III subunit epsilon
MHFPDQLKETILNVFPRGIIALDFETTGLSALTEELVEIGAVKMGPTGQLSYFQSLIKPDKEIPEDIIAIHGISNDMVAEAPTIQSKMPEWREFLEDYDLLAHNALFDAGFLMQSFVKCDLDFPKTNIFCSVRLARAIKPQTRNHRLNTLAKKFKAPLESHHRASDDALACLWVTGGLLDLKKNADENWVKDHSMIFCLNEFDKEVSFSRAGIIDLLQPLVTKRQYVDIEYHGGKTRKTDGPWRTVRPIGLLPLPKGPILHAQCMKTGELKSFSLKRINDVRALAAEEQEKWEQKRKEFTQGRNEEEA